MRQTGLLAASCAYALTYNFPQLPRVHTLARRLEQGLEDLGVKITSGAETCMVRLLTFPIVRNTHSFSKVFFDPSPLGISYYELVTRANELPNPIKLGGSRLVVHIQTSPEAVEDFLALVKELAEEKKKDGFLPESNGHVETNGAPYSNIYVRAGKK